MLAMLAAGLVVGGVVVGLVLRAGGGKGREENEAVPAVTAAREAARREGEAQANQRNAADYWYSSVFLGPGGEVVPVSGRRVREAAEEVRARKFDTVPGFDWPGKERALYEAVLREHPEDPEANAYAGRVWAGGYPDFWNVFRRLRDATYVPEEINSFRKRYEEAIVTGPPDRRKAPWFAREEYAAFAARLDSFVAFERRMAEDPSFAAIFAAVQRVKLHPRLGEYETVHITVPPFVMFYASRELVPKDQTPAELGRVERQRKDLLLRLEAHKKLLEDLRDYYAETWLKPLGARPFEPGDLFFVWVFGDRKTFEEYCADCGQHITPGLLGYFTPRDRWCFIYEDQQEKTTVAKTLAHELTHSLHWWLSNDPASAFKNHFERVPAVWLKEGWADYVGWCAYADGRYRFALNSPERMQVIHVMHKIGLPLVPVERLVERKNYLEWIQFCRKFMSDRNEKLKEVPGALDDLYLGLLYSESWLLIKFLNEGGGGRYRNLWMKYLQAATKGFAGYAGKTGAAQPQEAFAQVFSLAAPADWARFQKDFDAFVEEMCLAMPPGR